MWLEGDKELGSPTHHPSRGPGGLSAEPRWRVTEAEALNPGEGSSPIKGPPALSYSQGWRLTTPRAATTSLVPTLLGPLAPDGDRRRTRPLHWGRSGAPRGCGPSPGWQPPGPVPSAR